MASASRSFCATFALQSKFEGFFEEGNEEKNKTPAYRKSSRETDQGDDASGINLRIRRAEWNDILQEGCAPNQTNHSNKNIRGNSCGFCHLGKIPPCNSAEDPKVPGQINQQWDRRKNDSTLEPAAGSHLAMRHDINPKENGRGSQAQRQRLNGVAGLWNVPATLLFFGLFLSFIGPPAQQKAGTDHGYKKYGFLSQRVECAVIEIYGGHYVGRMPLHNGNGIQDNAVGPIVVADRWYTSDCRTKHNQKNTRDRKEQQCTNPAFHSLSRRILARASKIIRGSATAPIAICERATSGA